MATVANKYNLWVYPIKITLPERALCVYSGQSITDLDIPEYIKWPEGYVIDADSKYLVEMNDDLTVVENFLESKSVHDWIMDDLAKTNVHNSKVQLTKTGNRRKSIPIPSFVIIDQLKWDFIVATLTLGKYPLIMGPTGCGKTNLAEGLAQALGYNYYYLNCGSLFKPKASLVGTVQARDGSTFLVDSEFMTNFTSDEPTIIFLDEISRIPGAAANYIMTILDRKTSYIYVEELGKRIYKGKNVVFIAAANFGMQYTDTRKLDDALMNRFIPYHVEYLFKDDEVKLINMQVPGLNQLDVVRLVNHANLLRDNFESLGQEVSHRHTIDLAGFLSVGFTYSEVMNNILVSLFVNGSDDRRSQVKQILGAKSSSNKTIS